MRKYFSLLCYTFPVGNMVFPTTSGTLSVLKYNYNLRVYHEKGLNSPGTHIQKSYLRHNLIFKRYTHERAYTTFFVHMETEFLLLSSVCLPSRTTPKPRILWPQRASWLIVRICSIRHCLRFVQTDELFSRRQREHRPFRNALTDALWLPLREERLQDEHLTHRNH